VPSGASLTVGGIEFVGGMASFKNPKSTFEKVSGRWFKKGEIGKASVSWPSGLRETKTALRLERA
jgi:hypothetical protein